MRFMPQLIGTRFSGGLSRPVFLTAPSHDNQHVFVVEQTGRIRILNRATGFVLPTPFLDIAAGLSIGGERGLLGLAFHPNYANNGLFYINCTEADGSTNLRRYKVSSNPLISDPNSMQLVLKVAQPFPNHNGGWLAFGKDNLLYAALGDGG